MKWLIGTALFGAGFFAGVQFTKWYAQTKVTTAGDKAISAIVGSGYAGQVVKGVFDQAVDMGINN